MNYQRLDSVASIIQGGRHRKSGKHFTETGYPAFGAGGLNGQLPFREFDAPAIVLSSIGARCGKCFLTPNEWTSLANTQIIDVDSSAADLRFLWHQLNDEKSWIRRGTAQPYIRPADVKSRRVFLPPLDEQRRIAAILDKADAIRRKRQEAIQLTEELLRSAFLEMFDDPVTNPKGWPEERLAEQGTLDRGKSKHRPRNDPTLLGGKHPLIQTGEVANSGGLITEYTRTYSDLGLRQSRMWPAGTLCITIAANIAKTGILSFDACFPDSVVGFTPKSGMTTEYIQAWLSFLQPLLEARAPQVAQKNINLKILRALYVPIPPIDLLLQHREFVTAVRRSFTRLKMGSEGSDNLFNALVQRAFRGEL